MITIILQGEPKSTQNIYKATCRGGIFASVYMSVQGKTIKESYQWQAKSQYRKATLKGNLEVIIRLYFGTKRKCDWDNFHKLSCDALTGIVWEDDSQIQRATVEKYYDKKSPRIEIEIYDIE
jgi:Holliday junction resolvase RusA-like endonuclease